MPVTQKITQKEWRQFVEQRLANNSFSRMERDAIRSCFHNSLQDVDYGERRPFFGQPQPGITAEEVKDIMSSLRDRNSDLSRSMKVRLSPEKLDKLEEILNEALKENKEHWF